MKKQELHQFCESLGAPVVLVSSSDGKIVHANERATELIGYSEEAAKKLEFVQLFDGKAQNRIVAAAEILKDASEEQKIKETNLQLRRRAGRYVPVNVAGSLVVAEKERFYIFNLEDLSEIHRLQDEKEKLKEEMNQVGKLADIGRLAAGMAHELNNPLAVIQGFAENIQWMIEDGEIKADKLKTQVEPILRQTQRMSKIISKMMSMARGGEPELEIVSMRSIVQGTLPFYESQFDHYGIDFQVDIDHGLMFACDVTRIEQIIINIVNNAIHALEKRPEDRKVVIEGHTNGDAVVMKVWNNGPEIPEDLKSKIFTPFFTTKTVGEGTGLGLFLSYSIMKAHGGDMWFESGPKGTSFFLKFQKTMAKGNQELRFKSKVLIVDDESFFRQIFLRKLGRFGYEVVSVKGVSEALAALENDPEIVALFTDLRMPQASGIDLVREVRARNRSVLVFVVTGYSQDPQLLANSGALMIDAILRKPIDPNELNLAVEKIRLFAINKMGRLAAGA